MADFLLDSDVVIWHLRDDRGSDSRGAAKGRPLLCLA